MVAHVLRGMRGQGGACAWELQRHSLRPPAAWLCRRPGYWRACATTTWWVGRAWLGAGALPQWCQGHWPRPPQLQPEAGLLGCSQPARQVPGSASLPCPPSTGQLLWSVPRACLHRHGRVSRRGLHCCSRAETSAPLLCLKRANVPAPIHCPCPAEFCERGSLVDLLAAVRRDPASAAALPWQRRLSMVRAHGGCCAGVCGGSGPGRRPPCSACSAWPRRGTAPLQPTRPAHAPCSNAPEEAAGTERVVPPVRHAPALRCRPWTRRWACSTCTRARSPSSTGGRA